MQSVAKNVKFRSNQIRTDQYIAENAMQRKDRQEEVEDIRLRRYVESLRKIHPFII
ncbi:MAG: hypothetical protein NWE78_02105 [Candidatus Bathyarchaeota archaeon]|nr:hypothetical protein [Candidatus Bathyarchaeota archaeon]